MDFVEKREKLKNTEFSVINLIKKTYLSEKVNGLVVHTLDIFNDIRGEIWTIYDEEFTDIKFIADKVTISRFGVLRGFHGDSHTAKLITCLSGQIQLAVLDLRKDSKSYGKSESFILNDCEPTVVVVPKGCVNAHLCLSDKCVFYYKWSDTYKGPDAQVTIAWDDPQIGIPWVISKPILSDRDKSGVFFNNIYL